MKALLRPFKSAESLHFNRFSKFDFAPPLIQTQQQVAGRADDGLSENDRLHAAERS